MSNRIKVMTLIQSVKGYAMGHCIIFWPFKQDNLLWKWFLEAAFSCSQRNTHNLNEYYSTKYREEIRRTTGNKQGRRGESNRGQTTWIKNKNEESASITDDTVRTKCITIQNQGINVLHQSYQIWWDATLADCIDFASLWHLESKRSRCCSAWASDAQSLDSFIIHERFILLITPEALKWL